MASCQTVIALSAEEREELVDWSKSRTLPAGDVFKARLILALCGRQELQRGGGRAEHVAADDCALAGAVPTGSNRGAGRPVPWQPSSQSVPFDASEDSEKDAAETRPRQHALVLSQDGGRGRREPGDGPPDLGEGRAEATLTGSLHGQQRSGV
jgi:hypothetical protein